MAKKFQVRIKNGDVLKGWSWPAENAAANLTIMTGMNEYALRYDRVAKWFNEHGVNVWCLDAYGQGRNAASEELQERTTKAGVAFTGGPFFGAETGKGFLRFNFACPREQVEEAIKRMEKAFKA